MKKLAATLIGVFALSLTVAGCSSPHSAQDPAIIGEGGWELEYIQVAPGEVIPCLWNSRQKKDENFSCDWQGALSAPPANALDNTVGQGKWELEYVNYNGSPIRCLWHGRETGSQSFSCDFSPVVLKR